MNNKSFYSFCALVFLLNIAQSVQNTLKINSQKRTCLSWHGAFITTAFFPPQGRYIRKGKGEIEKYFVKRINSEQA